MIRHDVKQLTGAFLSAWEVHPDWFAVAYREGYDRYRRVWSYPLFCDAIERQAAAFVCRSEMAALWLSAVCFRQLQADGYLIRDIYFSDRWPSGERIAFCPVNSKLSPNLLHAVAAFRWTPSDLYKTFNPSYHIEFY